MRVDSTYDLKFSEEIIFMKLFFYTPILVSLFFL